MKKTLLKINDRLIYRIIRKLISILLKIKDKKIHSSNIHIDHNSIENILLNYHLSKIEDIDNTLACYRSVLKKGKTYNLFTQARMILILLNIFDKTENAVFKEYAHKLASYIIKHQEKNGLFSMNNPFWVPRDEGIITALVIISLTKLYKYINDEMILKSAENAGYSLRKYLYSDKNGYIHTYGQDYWIVNVSAAAAYAYDQLYELTNTQDFLNWSIDGYNHVISKIRDDWLFPYSKIQSNMYLTAYNAINIYYLINIFKSKNYIDKRLVLKKMLINLCIKLEEFVKEDGSIVETSISSDAYINSSAACYAVLSTISPENNKTDKIKKYIRNFYKNGAFNLYIKDGFLHNKYHLLFRDNILLETLFWLYEGENNKGILKIHA